MSKPLVEILYFEGCPNHEPARALVERTSAALGIETELRLVEVGDDASARRHRFLGSPTIRVNGRDIDPAAARAGRVLAGLPPIPHGARNERSARPALAPGRAPPRPLARPGARLMGASAPSRLITVGSLARRTGMSRKTIRELEGLGLIYSAGRSEANYRLFDEQPALWCVSTVRDLRSLGLELAAARGSFEHRCALRRAAREVGDALGYAYPQFADDAVSAHMDALS